MGCGGNCSCANCTMKSSTLGALGWLPNGFGTACVPEGNCYPAQLPPSMNVGQASEATQFRAGAAIGLGISGLLTYGGVSLWKKKHPVWGGLLLILGAPGLLSGSYQLVTGVRLFVKGS